jgi:hypothetical protein
MNRSRRAANTANDPLNKGYARPSSSVSWKCADTEKRHIDEELRLFKADGSASNLLRHTISSALISTQFDSVPSLLAARSPAKEPNENELMPGSSFLRDKSQHMVSVMGSARKKSAAAKQNSSVSSPDPSKPRSLAIRDVKYTGFEINNGGQAWAVAEEEEKEICFNCWSAGEGMKCLIPADSIGGKNLSMCSNWDVGFLRRKYRSEEIMEVFSQQSQSLKFDKASQQFCTYEEAKHPIYRLLNQHVSRINFIYQRRHNVKMWLTSFICKLKEGSFQNNRSKDSATVLCLRGTTNNMDAVQKLTRELAGQLPKAPVTGTTMKEKLGQEQVLVERVINVDGVEQKSNLVIAGPTPVPQALYRPRKYGAPPPITFILPANPPSEKDSERQLDFDSWQRDPNNFIQYATFGRKRNENLAIGGLSKELLVSKQFIKCFPPQYKDITCSDSSIIVPPRNDGSLSFPTLDVPPDALPYIRRELVTTLDARRPPTVMTKVGIDKDERHYFGLNRVEQTGEEGDFGFRTSTWATIPELDDRIDPTTFRPSESIATPNATAVTPFRTMHVDATYPFRQEKSRKNCVNDLFHLLLSNGDCSKNKLQVFTTVGSQQAGYFMQNGDASLPIGRVVTKVIRTWAFLQGEPDRGDDPYDDPPSDRVYKEEKLQLGLDGVLFNSRPRFPASMPGEVLASNSRPHARDAILGKMDECERKDDESFSNDPPRVQGLLDIAMATRVGKKHVNYLPFELNLPSPRNIIEKFKPKTSLDEWAEREYNPWASGTLPLSTHFVWSLTQETKKWPKPNHNIENTPASNTAKEFAALCSFVRHGKYRDLEDTINNPDWSLPIDYCDDSGNTLLMIACQNGNRRITKLCLRRGSKINKQNLNGNSCLHFAFGYGFGKLKSDACVKSFFVTNR